MAAELIKLENDSQTARIAQLLKEQAKGATTIGGFTLPLGKHELLVAEKDAFGFLNVTSKATKDRPATLFSLPIVAGTLTYENGVKISVEVSARPGAKTLVIPDGFYVEMACNATYTITVEERNGRKVVTNVSSAEIEENVVPAVQVRTTPKKKKELAF
jgi:hypothetical protein